MNILHYKDKFYATNNTSDGLKAISIIKRAYVFNTDVRDAFFGHYKLEKDAAAVTNPSIPALTRPFAKLTIKKGCYKLQLLQRAGSQVQRTCHV